MSSLSRRTLVFALSAALVLAGASPAFAETSDIDGPVVTSVSGPTAPLLPGSTNKYVVEFTEGSPRPDVFKTNGEPWFYDPDNNGLEQSFLRVSEEAANASVESLGVDPDGVPRFRGTITVDVPKNALYGDYSWLLGSVSLFDSRANATPVVMPSMSVADDAHPVANHPTRTLTAGKPRRAFPQREDRSSFSEYSVFPGDELAGSLDAPGANVTYEWFDDKVYSPASATSKFTVPATLKSSLDLKLKATARWPDGTTRERLVGGGYTTALMVPAGTFTLPGAAKVGETLRANFAPNAELETLFPGVTSGLKYTWYRRCWFGSCFVSGREMYLVPGDENTTVILDVVDADAAKHPGIYLLDLPFGGDSVVRVGAGSVPTPVPVLASPTVGKRINVDLSGFKGATRLDAVWEPAGLAAVQTLDIGSVASIVPPRHWVGRKLTLSVVAHYQTGRESKSVRSTAVAVAPARQVLGKPAITGAAQVGSKLSVSVSRVGLASGTGVTWQWYRGSKVIAGAYSASYTLTAADRGAKIYVLAKANAEGYAQATAASSATAAVKLGVFKKGTLSIKGTARQGKQLKVALKSWPSGLGLKFQWLRNGKTIKKATNPIYRLTSADRGKKITVRMVATKPGYQQASVVSAAKKIAVR